MKSKFLKKVGFWLLATIIVAGSFAVWAHFARKEWDADELERLAKEQEFLDRRYPVKAGKPSPKPSLAPLPVRDGVPVRPATGRPVSLHPRQE